MTPTKPTKGSNKSYLAIALVVLVVMCVTALPAASQGTKEGEGKLGAAEVEEEAGGPATDREFHVPATARSSRPKGASTGLDALLQLPRGFVTTAPRVVAGAVQSEWRRRFVQAEREVLEAQTSLKDTKRELDGVASEGGSSQWSIAPPGGESSPSTSPLSFKLRQQLREDRERITVSQRAMRGLRIEADLAGVPQSWRAVNPNSAEPDQN